VTVLISQRFASYLKLGIKIELLFSVDFNTIGTILKLHLAITMNSRFEYALKWNLFAKKSSTSYIRHQPIDFGKGLFGNRSFGIIPFSSFSTKKNMMSLSNSRSQDHFKRFSFGQFKPQIATESFQLSKKTTILIPLYPRFNLIRSFSTSPENRNSRLVSQLKEAVSRIRNNTFSTVLFVGSAITGCLLFPQLFLMISFLLIGGILVISMFGILASFFTIFASMFGIFLFMMGIVFFLMLVICVIFAPILGYSYYHVHNIISKNDRVKKRIGVPMNYSRTSYKVDAVSNTVQSSIDFDLDGPIGTAHVESTILTTFPVSWKVEKLVVKFANGEQLDLSE